MGGSTAPQNQTVSQAIVKSLTFETAPIRVRLGTCPFGPATRLRSRYAPGGARDAYGAFRSRLSPPPPRI